MAKSSPKAAARPARKGSAASTRAPKPASRGAKGRSSSAAKGSAARSTGASRWSRGKPISGTKVASSRPMRVAPAPLAIRDPSHEEISHHAYLRWLTHGGSEHENWYAAEQELRSRRDALRSTRVLRGSS